MHNIAQSRTEIERKFGKLEAETIDENAIVKQWFGFSSMAEAKRASEAMGEMLALQASLNADNLDTKLGTGLSLGRQRHLSAAQLLAMPRTHQLVHIKGAGFFVCRKIAQNQIGAYAELVAPNRLEGGRLPPDIMVSLTMPYGCQP